MAKQKRKQEREKVPVKEKAVKKTCLHCECKFTTGMNGYCSGCVELSMTDNEPLRGREKCAVAGCENHTDQGEFVGNLCFPCHDYLSSESSPKTCSQAYRNEHARFCKKVMSRLTEVAGRFLADVGRPSVADQELANLCRGPRRG